MQRFYPIGTPGQPWTDIEKSAWFEGQKRQRSYQDEVVAKLKSLPSKFEVSQYGKLSINPEDFPLFAVMLHCHNTDAPWALVTGGVHGYETSGVQGALDFLATKAAAYTEQLNLLVIPCVSPWAYEVVNRWNPQAIDPNRSFYANSPAEESAALVELLSEHGSDFLVHVDLHETTDSDEDEFRPALAAREGKTFEPGYVPDGFYAVGDTLNPQGDFQAAIVAAVERVTHIAPPDAKGQLFGSEIEQRGVINYPCRKLGLCAGVTNAVFKTTTEVYPDSPKATPDICNEAQVVAVKAALDYALADRS